MKLDISILQAMFDVMPTETLENTNYKLLKVI